MLRFSVTSVLLSALACADEHEVEELSLASLQQSLADDDVAAGDDDEPSPVDASVIIDGGPLDEASTPPPPRIDGGIRPPREGGVAIDGGNTFGPVAQWRFDDCSPSSTLLVDSSERALHALRSAGVQCVSSVSGLGVVFDERRDVIEAPPNVGLGLSDAMTVALWVNPKSAQGALVNKQLQGNNVFELALDRGRVTFSVALRNGTRTRRVSSSAPISTNRWTHVAGVYDGEFVRLFRDGRQVGQLSATGPLADVNGAIRIGNNANSQFVTGQLDEVMLFQRALPEFEVAALSCIRQPAIVSVTPASAGPVEPDVSVTYDVAVTNRNVGACAASRLFLFAQSPPEISARGPDQPALVEAGQTVHMPLVVTATSDAEPGTHQIPFQLFDFGGGGEPQSGQVEFILAAPSGCFVRTGRELLMTDLSVIEDPIRTTFDGPADDPRAAAWTFARLMEQMARTADDAPAMVEQLFNSWLSDQTVNTFVMPRRGLMSDLVLQSWPRVEGGALDLTRAPLRLLAIVNRLDVRNLAKGHAGEGRFVFGVLDPAGFPMEFTIILEYRLPGTTTADVLAWAERWHALGQLPFPSEEYNAALQALTTRFAGRGAEPARPNGSALSQLRTNEIALNGPWELREFHLSPTTGRLVPGPVDLTPDTSFLSGSSLVADYVNQNEAAILIERHEVPALFQGVPFLGASSFNDLLAWRAPGINNPEARHRFSLNTCNGCHASEETGTGFLHIGNRFPGERPFLSGFMTGTTVGDPETGIPRTFNDLARRNADLKAVVCGGVASTVTTPLPPAPAPAGRPGRASATREQFLSRGIGRVH